MAIRKIIVVGLGMVAVATCLLINSCTHAPYVMPIGLRTGDPEICFERDILPIFISKCTNTGCHNAASHESGYQLDSYNNIVRKGIVPGNKAASKIWESIAISSFDVEKMPLNAPGLSARDLDLIGRWIATGAIDSGVSCGISTCDSGSFAYASNIAPIMNTYCVGCHNTASSAGGMLTNYASVKNAAVNGRLIGNITHAAGYKPMPPSGTGLSACQIAQIKNWVATGTPNN